MAPRDIEKEKLELEQTLQSEKMDFSAAFLNVQALSRLLQTHPEIITPKTISALICVLNNERYASQKQSFFLYKQTADTLVVIPRRAVQPGLATMALTALQQLLATDSPARHEAVAEALGELPLKVASHRINERLSPPVPPAAWRELMTIAGISASENRTHGKWIGRSLVASRNDREVFVIKLLRRHEEPESIHKEATWMAYLNTAAFYFPVRFDIPEPIQVSGSYLFRLQDLPPAFSDAADIHAQRYAIGFIAHKDYFVYPNDHRADRRLGQSRFSEVLLRNSWLLGNLTAQGIVHTAPIPLFHNRIQRHRRSDRGIYEWPRGGRLDRWLHSCHYPNFGLSGLRDFEHLEICKAAGRTYYDNIGAHLLSLVLVAGSYFRNRVPHLAGLDQQGNPADTRRYFDKSLLKKLTWQIFLQYYNGFTGERFEKKFPLDLDRLAERTIEEMGIDHHMEEILRTADQMQMSDEAFITFLRGKGYAESEIACMQKGENDITTFTGPHLGGFNQKISLPELITFLASAAALCISGKFCREKEL